MLKECPSEISVQHDFGTGILRDPDINGHVGRSGRRGLLEVSFSPLVW